MTVMVDTPHIHEHSQPANSSIEPLPELETVAAGDDLTLTGAFAGDSLDTDAAAATAIELDMLTSLLWAPPTLARQVAHTIIGPPAARNVADSTTTLPSTATLFWRPAHQYVFDTAVAILDEGTPATVSLVQARIIDDGNMARVHSLILELAAPRYGRSVAASEDLPHLAAAVVDGWYRRGYNALLARMTHVVRQRPATELAGHWAALTTHAQTAETRWLAIRDNLARI